MAWYPFQNWNVGGFEDWITGTTGNTGPLDELVTWWQGQNDPPPAPDGSTLDDSYKAQVANLIAEINDMVGAGGFGGIWDTAMTSAETEFGDTGQTAGQWGAEAGAIDYGTSFQDWMAAQGYTQYDATADTAGMQALIDQLQNPDTEAGFSHAARMLGFGSDEEAQAALESFRTAMEGGSAGQQGMSPEDMALRERYNQANMREMEARSQRLVQNSFANSGSTVQMLSAADEANRGLSLAQFQQDEALARDQVERQMTQWGEQSGMYQQMVQNRQMSYSDYMQMKTTSLSAALEGYSSKINAMQDQNAQYLAEHRQDMDILEQNAMRLFAMADLQRGLSADTFEMAQNLYNQQVQQYIDAINLLLATDPANFGGEAWSDLMEYLTMISSMVVAIA